MKHLKTYEIKVGNLTDKFKNFIIIKDKNSINLYHIRNYNYTCSLLAHINNNTLKISKSLKNKQYFKITNVINWEDEILYQSNNFYKAVDRFDLLNNEKKYNI